MSSLPRLRESGLLRWISVWMDGGSLGGWMGDDDVDGRRWIGCVVDGVDQWVVREAFIYVLAEFVH